MKLTWPLGDKDTYPIGPIIDGENYGTEDAHVERGEGLAVDIPAPQGTPIYACHDAVVALAHWLPDAGYAVWLQWQEDGHRWQSRDCHMPDIEVDVGRVVSAGDRIGAVGSTGRSTGPHNHFVLECDGERVRPSEYFTEGETPGFGGERMLRTAAQQDVIDRMRGFSAELAKARPPAKARRVEIALQLSEMARHLATEEFPDA